MGPGYQTHQGCHVAQLLHGEEQLLQQCPRRLRGEDCRRTEERLEQSQLSFNDIAYSILSVRYWHSIRRPTHKSWHEHGRDGLLHCHNEGPVEAEQVHDRDLEQQVHPEQKQGERHHSRRSNYLIHGGDFHNDLCHPGCQRTYVIHT